MLEELRYYGVTRVLNHLNDRLGNPVVAQSVVTLVSDSIWENVLDLDGGAVRELQVRHLARRRLGSPWTTISIDAANDLPSGERLLAEALSIDGHGRLLGDRGRFIESHLQKPSRQSLLVESVDTNVTSAMLNLTRVELLALARHRGVESEDVSVRECLGAIEEFPRFIQSLGPEFQKAMRLHTDELLALFGNPYLRDRVSEMAAVASNGALVINPTYVNRTQAPGPSKRTLHGQRIGCPARGVRGLVERISETLVRGVIDGAARIDDNARREGLA